MSQYTAHISPITFQHDLISWYQTVKRDLPWRENLDPYRILVSEIMLQQTQVVTVIPYYNRFMKLFPTAEALAKAPEDELLKAWEGLGYYSRARNLQASARMIVELGQFPTEFNDILKLKGVGPYTAGAVGSIAFGLPVPAVDGNVFRVFSRIGKIDHDITLPSTRKVFETAVSSLISQVHPGDFNQGLMELGATICTPKLPKCMDCPLRKHCLAYQDDVVLELPVKSKAVKQKKIYYAVAIIENENGEWLLTKRPSTGLLADFHEFQQFEYTTGTSAEMIALQFPDAQQITYKNATKHIFTHLIWLMDFYHVKMKSQDVVLHDNDVWINPLNLSEYSVTTPHLKGLKSSSNSPK